MPRPLDSFPRPNVATDLVVLTVAPASGQQRLGLGLLVQRDPGGTPALPGRFVREGERLVDCVTALLTDKLGGRPSRGLELRMIDVFDDPGRDPRGWVLAVGYSMGLPPERAGLLTAEVVSVRGTAEAGSRRAMTPEHLAYDHDTIVRTAVRRMRRRYERSPDPDGLLTAPFTLSQLRHVHEAVLDAPLKRDTFNRRMQESLDALSHSDGSPRLTSETVGRPAQLFAHARRSRRAGNDDPFALPRSPA